MTIGDFLQLIPQLFWLFLPAGFANMAPVLFHNHLKWLAVPIDGGMEFGGKSLFGSHKTWRGLLVAGAVGGVLFLAQQALAYNLPETVYWSPFNITHLPWWFGIVFGLGAIGGDLVKSFFKRRVGIAPGHSWIPFDQIDFILGSGLVAQFFLLLTWQMWVLLIVVGLFAHITVKHIGFWLHIEKSSW